MSPPIVPTTGAVGGSKRHPRAVSVAPSSAQTAREVTARTVASEIWTVVPFPVAATPHPHPPASDDAITAAVAPAFAHTNGPDQPPPTTHASTSIAVPTSRTTTGEENSRYAGDDDDDDDGDGDDDDEAV